MTEVCSVDRYQLKNPVRIVTAASLFDGHDAAINLMRRLLQASGVEVIHLGHNRSAAEIVECAIQEDAQAIAVTSYQGGHIEFFKYIYDLLAERGSKIKVFGGGGGTILKHEIDELHAYGICRIYSPDDGRVMGLQGMIDDLLKRCDFPIELLTPEDIHSDLVGCKPEVLARFISTAENDPEFARLFSEKLRDTRQTRSVVLGITGTGGAGKSSLVDEFIHRFLIDFSEQTLAVISVDPTKRRSGGALLGDRIRMNAVHNSRVYMRSLATRQSNVALSSSIKSAIQIVCEAGFDLVIVETSGIGQSDSEVVDHVDVSLYVMTAEYGAATQLEKIDMIDFADAIAINKFDKPGSEDALRDVRKQFRRSRTLFDVADDELPVYGTTASQFNDSGMNRLYGGMIKILSSRGPTSFESTLTLPLDTGGKSGLISAARSRYLSEVADTCEHYDRAAEAQVELVRELDGIDRTLAALIAHQGSESTLNELRTHRAHLEERIDQDAFEKLRSWDSLKAKYEGETYQYEVRGKSVEQQVSSVSLSGTRIPKVSLPRYKDMGDRLRWLMQENVPGAFPFTAGVFPLKREGEAPARMFAGEGGPERTNRRFHYLSQGLPAARLSTAFDSVTLYGDDPDHRPDIYGKIGNSGVSICTVDDAKKLYSGFDLADPKTSVSMTINGPAPMVLAFFMNAAIDQGCEKHIREQGIEQEIQAKVEEIFRAKGCSQPRYEGECPSNHSGLGLSLLGVSGCEVLPRETYEKIKSDVMSRVRGTVQADILKEDQAQNTCIFSTEFALRMMGDIQESFTRRSVKNFYSVSISGYHIAEAGANPITQLAFTLANGFTLVEYYLARGLKIDDFAPNLSFFFSNGMEPEYSVLGRVARRIWSKAMLRLYGANERSQKLKYHIQTSGRSLHAQEIAFNDIRTTLQALSAISDNCNSLHTNAYDEAITTPTETSVRQALAIQLIIEQEFGLSRNENPLQGAFVIEELTDLVEAAVLEEFRRLSERGGVLGAMERMYQRSKIQEESLLYETLKHSGQLPVVGVNTFLDPEGSPTSVPEEVIRSTPEEKALAITHKEAFHFRNRAQTPDALSELRAACITGQNIFETLLETVQVASLGQISSTLYEVGGQYRRNM